MITTSVTRNWAADWIMKPSPRVAATSSAATSVDQPAPSAMRRPVRIEGRALGRMTWRTTWRCVAPSERAALMRSCETPRTPDAVDSSDRRQHGDGDHQDLRRLADAEPDDDQRQIGQRRDRPQEFQQRIEDAAPDRADADGKPDRHADDDGRDQCGEHPARLATMCCSSVASTKPSRATHDEFVPHRDRRGQEHRRHQLQAGRSNGHQ